LGQDTLAPIPEVDLPDDTSGAVYKDYFFDDKLKINDSTSLVVFTRNPQTQMAKDLGHRIYSDTNFIRRLKNDFYELKNPYTPEIVHFCDFDIFFYSYDGHELNYLNKLNSHCDISKINCRNLDVLFRPGSELRVDTLSSFPERYKNDKSKLFTEDVIVSYFENTESWDICKNSRLPRIYYDGYAVVNIKLDTALTIEENIKKYIKQYTDDLNDINWNVWSHTEGVREFIEYKQPSNVDLFIYLKKEVFDEFKELDIEKIEPRITENRRLLIFYND
tara:strand:- start:610 stop:1437 length:828 start_codon:yes stop_codon:yes gene_type:complete